MERVYWGVEEGGGIWADDRFGKQYSTVVPVSRK